MEQVHSGICELGQLVKFGHKLTKEIAPVAI